MKFFKQFVHRLVIQVFGPVFKWIEKRSWFVKFILLNIILIVTGLLFMLRMYPNEVKAAARSGKYYCRAFLGPRTGAIPLTNLQRQELHRDINGIVQLLKSETMVTNHLNAWSIGQILAALPDTNGVDVLRLTEEAKKYLVPASFGYKQSLLDNFPQIQVSAWLAYGYGTIGKPIGIGDLDFLLNNQDSQGDNSGWWPFYPCLERHPENASTYVTAWCVLALEEQMSRGLISPDQTNRVETIINNGEVWLREGKVTGRARWYDYPQAPLFGEKMESLSSSALVLHTLHILDSRGERNDFRELDSEWMAGLPNEVPSPAYKEVSGVAVQSSANIRRVDAIRQYVLPAEIIVTVDAYKNANFIQKAHALRWIDQLIDRLPEFQNNIQGAYWISAELLIGLRYMDSGTS
jgi:hypothetical protein